MYIVYYKQQIDYYIDYHLTTYALYYIINILNYTGEHTWNQLKT